MDFDGGRPRYGRLAGVVAGVDVGPGVVDHQVAPRLAAAPPLRQDFDAPARVGRRVVRHNLHFSPTLKLNWRKRNSRVAASEDVREGQSSKLTLMVWRIRGYFGHFALRVCPGSGAKNSTDTLNL